MKLGWGGGTGRVKWGAGGVGWIWGSKVGNEKGETSFSDKIDSNSRSLWILLILSAVLPADI